MYNKQYTTPITVWYQQCIVPITQIKWCLLYFDDQKDSKDTPSNEDANMHTSDG